MRVTRAWIGLWALLACSDPQDVDPAPGSPPAGPVAPQIAVAPPPGEGDTPAEPGAAEEETPLELLVPEELPPKKKGFVRITGMVNADGTRRQATQKLVKICVHEPKELPCTGTRADGTFAIDLPESSRVALVFSGPGLTSTLRAFVTSKEDLYIGNTRIANDAGLSRVARAMETELVPGKGALFYSGIEGISARLEPPSGRMFYLSYSNEWEPEATGVSLRGSAGFVNVEPGLVGLRFSHPRGKCGFRPDNTFSGWPHEKDRDVAVVPVLADHHTYLTTMYCGK